MQDVTRDDAAAVFGDIVHRWPADVRIATWADQLVVLDATGEKLGFTYADGAYSGRYHVCARIDPARPNRLSQYKRLPPGNVPADPVHASTEFGAEVGPHPLFGKPAK